MGSRFLLTAALCLPLSACNGVDEQCTETAQILGPLTARSPGGVSGQALLDRAGAVHELRMREDLVASRNDVKTTMVNPSARATLRILPSGADYQLIQSKVAPCSVAGCSSVGLACLDRLELPVQIILKTQDGTFNEHWFGTLTAGAPSDPELQGPMLRDANEAHAWVNLRLSPKGFRGNFRVLEVGAPEEYKLQDHEMELALRFKGGKLVDGKIVSELRYESGSDRLVLRETDLWFHALR